MAAPFVSFVVSKQLPLFTFAFSNEICPAVDVVSCSCRFIANATLIANTKTAALSIDQSNRSQRLLKFQLTKGAHLTLKMASVQVVETSVFLRTPVTLIIILIKLY